ncbi:toxin-antitoxin system YwqK family antitoxin [Hymenobacter sp. IS2118]|uniref:toxin-antitoxin system YwqK family antitoxin n=1 Tax=Hymenobacter sp. IS2118 TaxID=1505605 RepID=UPI0005546893|nr:hypothetical protein [Hymenobacter sp. IS2118]
MKLFLLLLSGLATLPGSTTRQTPADTTRQKRVAMSDTYQRPSPEGSRYYERGSTRPYTGLLYGRYANGQYQTIQQFQDGLGNGYWIDFDPEGRKERQGTYRANRIEGPVTCFYENGRVKSKGQYRHWKRPIGEWVYYDQQGRVAHRMTYTP